MSTCSARATVSWVAVALIRLPGSVAFVVHLHVAHLVLSGVVTAGGGGAAQKQKGGYAGGQELRAHEHEARLPQAHVTYVAPGAHPSRLVCLLAACLHRGSLHRRRREVRLRGMPLSEREKAILDFERRWWSLPGPKEASIRRHLAMS